MQRIEIEKLHEISGEGLRGLLNSTCVDLAYIGFIIAWPTLAVPASLGLGLGAAGVICSELFLNESLPNFLLGDGIIPIIWY